MKYIPISSRLLTRAEQIRLFLATAISFVLVSPIAAHAQTAFLNGLLTWVQGSVITTLGTLAIIVVGLVMLAMRAHFAMILAVCAGVWIIFNASTLVSTFRQ